MVDGNTTTTEDVTNDEVSLVFTGDDYTTLWYPLDTTIVKLKEKDFDCHKDMVRIIDETKAWSEL